MTDKKTKTKEPSLVVVAPESETAQNLPATKPAPPKNKGGRPSKYDPEIARQMCEQLSEGIPLREICRQEGFPAWRTVYDWMGKDPDLSTAIAHARDVGYDALAEECLDIADNANNDWMERFDEEGRSAGWEANGEHIQRSKLRIETRLKLLAKFNPKKYGDRVTHGGDDNAPVVVEHNLNVFGDLLKAIKQQRQLEE
jgi:predicted secreted protein